METQQLNCLPASFKIVFQRRRARIAEKEFVRISRSLQSDLYQGGYWDI